MTSGVYPHKKTTKKTKKLLSEKMKEAYASGKKFGFQPGHKVNFGKKHSEETKAKMTATRLGRKYKIIKPKIVKVQETTTNIV